MITCNKCGYKAPEGAVNCPRCGSPLSTRMEGGPGSRTGGQDQAEIPAWLETLRVGERPAAPVSNSTNFSAADLIEDDSLPSWMRAGRSQPSGPSVSDAFNALHPVSGPGALIDQGAGPQKGLAAQSLIDEKSLPSWMREGSVPATPSTGFEASSLIDAAALPDWMRSLQAPESSPATQEPARPAADGATPDWMRSLQAPESSPAVRQSTQSAPEAVPDWMRSLQPSQPSAQSSQPSAFNAQPALSAGPDSGPIAPSAKGFSARDLLDEKALPSWMAQQDGGAAALPDNGQVLKPGSLSPSSLIDQNALPAWMTQQNGAAAHSDNGKMARPTASKTEQPGNTGPAIKPGSLSPSSLIDQSALPAWMQENGNASSRVSSSPRQSSPAWPDSRSAAHAPVQGPAAQNTGGPDGTIAASSFVDNNSLPDWLRSGAGQPATPSANVAGMAQQPEPLRTGTYSGPPRVENMRVPSRPKGEVNASDGSEVAANVFASVLGVASSAPQLPPSSSQASSASYGQQRPGQYGPMQGGLQNPPVGAPTQGPAYNNTVSGMNQQNQPAYASGSYGVGQINNAASRSNLGVPSPGAVPPQPSYNNAAGPSNEQKSSNKKHGLVDTLLGWLLH